MKTDVTLISVITPCFNNHKTISETIESVQQQTYPNFEHIIVDDGSQVPITETIQVDQYHKLTLIRQENKGVASARNTAVQYAQGKLLVFLDADDLIDKNYLAKVVTIFEQQSEISMVACYIQEFGRSNHKIKINPFKLQNFYYHNSLFPSIICIKRTDFEKVGGYNPKLKVCEDWDLYLKIASLNANVVIIPEYLFFYRKHIDQSSLTDLMGQDKTTVHKAYYLMYQSNQEFYNERLLSPLNVSYLLLKSQKRTEKTLRSLKMLSLINLIFAVSLIISYFLYSTLTVLIFGAIWFLLTTAALILIQNTIKKLKQFSIDQIPTQSQLFPDIPQYK